MKIRIAVLLLAVFAVCCFGQTSSAPIQLQHIDVTKVDSSVCIRHGLVRYAAARACQNARQVGSALDTRAAREQCCCQHARVSEGLQLQDGPTDGARDAMPGLVTGICGAPA
jgi:hypothetical protein